jgi:hypothetical protein
MGDARQKFQTYLFFLRHFDRLVRHGRNDESIEHLVTALLTEQQPLLAGIQPQTLTPARREVIRKRLFNAWNSETVARINSLFSPDVRVITNQWKPIQVYYAIYFLLAAIHELQAQPQRQTHEGTLRFCTLTIRQRFPSPWRCAYDFDASQCHDFAWVQLPTVVSGWNLTNHDDPSVFVAHFYRTTGLEKRYERWVEHGKKKRHKMGPRAGKRILIQEMNGGTVAFWDVLWRMRKWVNYKEAQAILEGQDYPDHVEEFDDRLNSILTTSAAALENVLYVLLGDETMTGMYASYLQATNGKVNCPELSLRRDLICGLPF